MACTMACDARPRNELIVLDGVEALQAATEDGHEANRVAAQVVEVRASVPSSTQQQLALGYWPPTLSSFENITAIHLAGHRMVHIPQAVVWLQKLQVLNVSRNTLTSLPPEIGDLPSLTELDASHNQLRALPPKLCQLTGLVALNVMGNQLTALPEGFGQLRSLVRCGLKGNQLAELPASFSSLSSLVELFITDNKLATLPAGFGSLSSLVKLQASFNPFRSLPPCLFQLPRLEMFRLAVGELEAWPKDLLQSGGLPCLSWCSLGGNPAALQVPVLPADLPTVQAAELGLAGKLGEGASGDVFQGTYQGQAVAVKLFKGHVSPDGRVEEELGISCAVRHPNLTRVRALVTEPQGLVLDLVEGSPLALKPTSQHLLRCKWAEGDRFSLGALLKVCGGVASALAYLHSLGICHGDVYAHNILVDEHYHPVLCDFGASYCYSPREEEPCFWEAMEVRAFGLLLGDMVARLGPDSCIEVQRTKPLLQHLVERCLAGPPAARPPFKEVVEVLHSLTPVAAAAV